MMVRSQEGYERFARATDGPMMVHYHSVVASVLIIPLVTPVHGTVAASFTAIDYSIWALFAVEYLAGSLGLAPSRRKFIRTSYP